MHSLLKLILTVSEPEGVYETVVEVLSFVFFDSVALCASFVSQIQTEFVHNTPFLVSKMRRRIVVVVVDYALYLTLSSDLNLALGSVPQNQMRRPTLLGAYEKYL